MNIYTLQIKICQYEIATFLSVRLEYKGGETLPKRHKLFLNGIQRR